MNRSAFHSQSNATVAQRRLRTIKLAHTFVWAFFASAIIALPFFAWQRRWAAATMLIAVVMVECLILAFNGMRCPMTPMAARYTEERADNFDIYLPLWLARYNKQIFGGLFVLGLILTLVRWITR